MSSRTSKKKASSSVSIVGMGYVGLCTAATFASRGITTRGVDVDQERIRQISQGRAPIHEPRLEGMLKVAVKRKLLKVSTETSDIADSTTTFLTVGTPSRTDGSIDLTFVRLATEQIAKTLAQKEDYHLVVVKSTVVPGTTNGIVRPILEAYSHKKAGQEIGLAANPEFLKEGTAIDDALNPDKIIIGANDEKSRDHLTRLYKDFYRRKLPPILVMVPEAAELVKYASNAFLATKISFINTIASVCQRTPGVDVNQIAEAIGHDPRIGPLFLKAGPGYGGSCFHKDLQAIIHYAKEKGFDAVLLRATEETNENQAEQVVELAQKILGTLGQKRIAILGLSFKKDTDDIREAASIRVINKLHEKGAEIVAYDPMAVRNTKKSLPYRIDFAQDSRSALEGADCAVIMTEWDEFKRLREKDFKALMRNANIVDARRIFQPSDFEHSNYQGIGIGT